MSEARRILIIEDNQDLANGLADNLAFEGYETQVAYDGNDGLQRARDWHPSLIILDLMLPGMDGYRVLSTLRDDEDTVPVLILTARSEEADKVMGFRVGADDYVTKPFGLLELLGRIHALLRRSGLAVKASHAPEQVRFGDVVIHPRTHTVERRGYQVAMRPKEYELLMALVRSGGDVVSRVDLLKEVWGYDATVVSRTVDTHLAELRRKLEDDPANPRHLLTVRKTGYRLQLD